MFNGIFYNLDAQDDPAYKYEDPSDLYEFGDQIGQGAFSIVYKAKFKPTGKIMAVKTLRPDRQCEVQERLTRQEAELLY